MKKRAELKNILGLTQEEMAMVLGVTKSQWSMYKSGQRDLSLDALQQFGKLLEGVKNAELKKEIDNFINGEKDIAKEKMKQEHINLQIKLHRLKKDIAILEKNRKECFAALQTASFLESNNDKYGLAASIKTRAIKSLQKHSLYKLEQMQLQKENFETLKNKLEQKVKIAENEI